MPGSRTNSELLRRRRVQILVALCALGLLAGIVAAFLSRSPTLLDARYRWGRLALHGDEYPYLLFVPRSARTASRVPLFVVLHGCNTTAAQQAVASGYAPLAEQHRFVVLYPEVDPVDLANGACWKGIWDPAVDGRGRGDAAAIAAMTRRVIRTQRIDPSRVYVIGISAGGFESSVLGATYPDLYAAIGIHSGAPYGAGEAGCLPERGPPPAASGLARAALAAMGPRARVMPVIVFHGDHDNVIPYRCGVRALHQWLDTDNLVLRREHRARIAVGRAASRTGISAPGHSYTVTSYRTPAGCDVAQLWTIHGMGHAWSGGSDDPAVLRYTYPSGPSAAVASARFFLQWTLGRTGPQCTRAARRRP